jgi:serine/threonine-protein kinase
VQPSAADFHAVGSEPDPLVGRVINERYKIVEQIGHGGMGRVYKALQAPLDRLVALKVLGAGHDRDPNFYKRFFLEASVTAKLTHPNTITLYDYGRTEDGIFYIAMEYLNGRTLSGAMQQDGTLAQERVIHIAQQVCRSLREAHALGIIHRDLKPANVMLLRQQDDHDFVKVLDFGLVKFFSGENPEGDITNAGTFMGSPHYIAPEQARNQSPDQRCDIYSLGVLLYHMLTGKVPFTAAAPVDIIMKHLHEVPVPPRQVRPDLAIVQELDDVVLKCMAKSREERYQSMDELLVQLKLVRTRVTGMAGPSSSPHYDTAPALHPVSNAALVAQTPHSAQPSMRTPSQPMPTMKTPAAGTRRNLHPPPPPAEALYEDDKSIEEVSTPASGTATPKPRLPKMAALIAAATGLLVVGTLVGVRVWRSSQPTIVVEKLPPAPPPPVAAATPVQPQPAQPAAAALPATPEQATSYQTANEGTTLVTISSTPTGAEVRDADDRMLGMTPFDLRVPSARPVQLTLRHEGFKPVTVRRKVEGEHVALSVTMKGAKADPYEAPPNKRSVGYKDDPY